MMISELLLRNEIIITAASRTFVLNYPYRRLTIANGWTLERDATSLAKKCFDSLLEPHCWISKSYCKSKFSWTQELKHDKIKGLKGIIKDGNNLEGGGVGDDAVAAVLVDEEAFF